MSDPSLYAIQIKQKLSELSLILRPAEIKEHEKAHRLLAEIKLLLSLLRAEMLRLESESRDREWSR